MTPTLHPEMPATAPACFGSAVAFSPNASECESCHEREACAVLATTARFKLSKELGLDLVQPVRKEAPAAREVKTRTPRLSVPPAAVAPELPVKARHVLSSILSAGIDLKKAAAERINPFTEYKTFMGVVLELLWAGGFTRAELREAFEKRLGYTESGASSHVSLTLPILFHLNVAAEKDGRIVLSE